MPLLPTITITMGDPAGIGPEVALAALADPDVQNVCRPVLLGDAKILRRVASQCQLSLPERVLSKSKLTATDWQSIDRPTLIDFGNVNPADFHPGHVSAATGQASYDYIQFAIELALQGRVDGVTTGPINKEALRAAGIDFPGHTEIFSTQTGSQTSCMMQYSPEITCSFVTTHVGYEQVTALLSVQRILEVIELSAQALSRIKNVAPEKLQFVVCGLNPHAGESGLFGHGEEEKIIMPAVSQARQLGLRVTAPLPPDTCFLPDRRKTTDCFICMYHDQGHIPLKALAFDEAVNTTLGLPIIRTSVDHGTALDIAWQAMAKPSSMVQAILLAAALASQTAATD